MVRQATTGLHVQTGCVSSTHAETIDNLFSDLSLRDTSRPRYSFEVVAIPHVPAAYPRGVLQRYWAGAYQRVLLAGFRNIPVLALAACCRALLIVLYCILRYLVFSRRWHGFLLVFAF